MFPRHFLLVLGFLLAPWMSAQRFYFERLDVQNGLPTSKVFSVLQDSTGMVWMGTEAGLVSYDGNDRDGVRSFGRRKAWLPTARAAFSWTRTIGSGWGTPVVGSACAQVAISRP
ncbi:MAG: hypothetical protein IPN38_12620 [Flavobacteriales bacterium]|nr:hypothetical protein [Flavobacteriales bacterium]